MRIREILVGIEQLAPLSLQESYDNSGVQIGDVNQEAKAALLCIDVTEDVIDEAISLGCNLVISHHPLAFHSFKSLTGKNYIERCMIKACKHDIVIYAAHTNLDNAKDGINNYLANIIGLEEIRILEPQQNKLLKLVTFVPTEHLETVRLALFNAGAGSVGNYDSCSYMSSGFGTFRAGDNSNPFCGTIGKLHTEKECRLEVILPIYKQWEVQQALIAVHPYEEPAFDFYNLANVWSQAGSGIVGSLAEPMGEDEFLYMLKNKLRLNTIQHSRFVGKKIRDVALCTGSGSFLLPRAMRYGADIFITGEAKYNDYYDVEDKIVLATIGHYESEIFTKNLFFDYLSKKYPNFVLNKSGYDENPVKYL